MLILKGVLDRCFPVFCLNPFLSLFLGGEFNPALGNNIKSSSISWGTIQQLHLFVFTEAQLLSALCKVGCLACSWGHLGDKSSIAVLLQNFFLEILITNVQLKYAQLLEFVY